MIPRLLSIAALALAPLATALAQSISYYPVPPGSRPHDVAPAPRRHGLVHGAGRGRARLPRPGDRRRSSRSPLGAGSAPHGVIVGPGRRAWITDGGLNAIVRVDPDDRRGATRSRCRPDRPTPT